MTRSPLGLCLSALSLLAFSAGPAPAQTPDAVQPDMGQAAPASGDATQKSSQKSSHSHSDAAGVTLLGVVAGGAALMGGTSGSDSSSSASSESSFTPSATAPEVIYTQPAPTITADAPLAAPIVISNPVSAIVNLPTPTPTRPTVTETTSSTVGMAAPASPVVTVTYPTTVSTPPSVTPIVFSPQPTGTQTLSIAPRAGLPLPVPSVPEPGTTSALALGSLLLVGLGLRARRNARC